MYDTKGRSMSLRYLASLLALLSLVVGCVAEPVAPFVHVVVVGGDDGEGGNGGGAGEGGSPGQGGASATASDASTTSTASGQGGAAGEGGATGEGGTGGAPCEPSPVDCAALPPGQCGDVSDDCGGTVMCGTLSGACDAGLWCNLDSGSCGCPMFANGDLPPDCDGSPGYEPRKCGDVASPDVPADCFLTGGVKLGFAVWCCPAG